MREEEKGVGQMFLLVVGLLEKHELCWRSLKNFGGIYDIYLFDLIVVSTYHLKR